MLEQRQASTLVRRGVKLLDRLNPKWFKEIDLAKFSLEDPEMCVLGQVYGDFHDALADIVKAGLQKDIDRLVKQQGLVLSSDVEVVYGKLDGKHYGFDIPNGFNSNESWEVLGQTWVRVIQKRQAQPVRRRKPSIS